MCLAFSRSAFFLSFLTTYSRTRPLSKIPSNWRLESAAAWFADAISDSNPAEPLELNPSSLVSDQQPVTRPHLTSQSSLRHRLNRSTLFWITFACRLNLGLMSSRFPRIAVEVKRRRWARELIRISNKFIPHYEGASFPLRFRDAEQKLWFLQLASFSAAIGVLS